MTISGIFIFSPLHFKRERKDTTLFYNTNKKEKKLIFFCGLSKYVLC